LIACNVRVSDNMTSSLLDSGNTESNNGTKKEKFPTKQSILQWISSITRDPMSILLRREDLVEIVNKPELPFTVIEPLMLALNDEELLDSSRTDKIYAAVLDSSMMTNPRNLKSYILRLTNSTDPSNDEVTLTSQGCYIDNNNNVQKSDSRIESCNRSRWRTRR